jgi:UDP-N-acetyl-alpha-D-muramoyl-L-alanyl-L-glutamate epimerase
VVTELHIDPANVCAFRYVSRHFDQRTGVATFVYALDELELVERYEFPLPSASVHGPEVDAARVVACERVLDQLFLAAGVSYYKMAVPAEIRIETGVWDARDIAAHREIFASGLGEFCFHNNLPARLTPVVTFEELAAGAGVAPPSNLLLDAGPLTPVGGGKDSCVSIEALRHAGFTPTQITVNRYPVIQQVISASGLGDLAVRRVLDARVGELNRNGALNGHVPVTAIVSLAVAAAAVLHGHGAVVMSNERSASEGNVMYQGVSINHQWSKSAEAEELLGALLARAVPELHYFSLLRSLSELSIVQRFAASCARYFDVFSSCNAAFRLDESRRVARWCGHCPKCQFVFLALATVLDRAVLEGIFGADLFSSSPPDGFAALLGLRDWKPFECVGESGECRVALRLVMERPDWFGHQALADFAQQVLHEGSWPDQAAVAAVFQAAEAPRVPVEFRNVLRGVLRADR